MGYVLESRTVRKLWVTHITEKWSAVNQVSVGSSAEHKSESLALFEETTKVLTEHLQDIGLSLERRCIDSVVKALLDDQVFDINENTFPILRRKTKHRLETLIQHPQFEELVIELVSSHGLLLNKVDPKTGENHFGRMIEPFFLIKEQAERQAMDEKISRYIKNLLKSLGDIELLNEFSQWGYAERAAFFGPRRITLLVSAAEQGLIKIAEAIMHYCQLFPDKNPKVRKFFWQPCNHAAYSAVTSAALMCNPRVLQLLVGDGIWEHTRKIDKINLQIHQFIETITQAYKSASKEKPLAPETLTNNPILQTVIRAALDSTTEKKIFREQLFVALTAHPEVDAKLDEMLEVFQSLNAAPAEAKPTEHYQLLIKQMLNKVRSKIIESGAKQQARQAMWCTYLLLKANVYLPDKAILTNIFEEIVAVVKENKHELFAEFCLVLILAGYQPTFWQIKSLQCYSSWESIFKNLSVDIETYILPADLLHLLSSDKVYNFIRRYIKYFPQRLKQLLSKEIKAQDLFRSADADLASEVSFLAADSYRSEALSNPTALLDWLNKNIKRKLSFRQIYQGIGHVLDEKHTDAQSLSTEAKAAVWQAVTGHASPEAAGSNAVLGPISPRVRKLSEEKISADYVVSDNKEARTQELFRLLKSNKPVSQAVVEQLCQAGVSLNSQDYLGNTVLHYAALHNRIDITQILLSYGSDWSIANHSMQTAWVIALSNRYTELLRVYIDYWASQQPDQLVSSSKLIFSLVNLKSMSASDYRVYRNHSIKTFLQLWLGCMHHRCVAGLQNLWSQFSILMDWKQDPKRLLNYEIEGQTALVWAMVNQYKEVAWFLLEKIFNGKVNKTVKEYGISKFLSIFQRHFIENQPNNSKREIYFIRCSLWLIDILLRGAIKQEDEDLIKALDSFIRVRFSAESIAFLDNKKGPYLHFAVEHGKVSMLKAFMPYHPNWGLKNHAQQTPLSWAISVNHQAAIEFIKDEVLMLRLQQYVDSLSPVYSSQKIVRYLSDYVAYLDIAPDQVSEFMGIPDEKGVVETEKEIAEIHCLKTLIKIYAKIGSLPRLIACIEALDKLSTMLDIPVNF
ncbi:MAG: ankyrin repeat domain-containing protein, partial [Gammaproteobacteria bacterium]|nr:ankyrin repeat domain-containing protein [Gammaproteobacteria bacterium]